jgi:hypothetical protein
VQDNEARRHPTIGGLRIGKALPERGVDDPLDQQLAWDRDGQYFHYLTKWAHALHQMWMVTFEEHYHQWAVELMCTAVQRCLYRRGGGWDFVSWVWPPVCMGLACWKKPGRRPFGRRSML